MDLLKKHRKRQKGKLKEQKESEKNILKIKSNLIKKVENENIHTIRNGRQTHRQKGN